MALRVGDSVWAYRSCTGFLGRLMHLRIVWPIVCQQFLYRLHDPEPHCPQLGPLSYDPALPAIIEAGLRSHLGNVGLMETARTSVSLTGACNRIDWRKT